ncbi:MAG: hypothetical protein AseanaTS_26040 [Candidatus Pelagadaptatus aseana]|uniref:hypothetical protein n=1 Tax=Candidatus Pelagadaptatus aseana TaxID=3120508 RepID=UPI0039B23EF6
MKTLESVNVLVGCSGLAVIAKSAALVAVMAFSSGVAQAQEPLADDVVSYEMNFYNPLKNGRSYRSLMPAAALDNEALIRAAEDIRSAEMSVEHRALNHRWLGDSDGEDLKFGGKVVSTLLQMGLRTYWDGIRSENEFLNSKAVPDVSGKGKLAIGGSDAEEVDYKIRLSGDKINLSVNYEF